MARIQILELPEGSSDDRPPFVLVIDESVPQRYILGPDDNPVRDYWQDIAQQIGARGVIVTPETVDIPANDTTAYLDTAASGHIPAGTRNELTIDGKPVAWTRVDEARTRAVDAVQELTVIARDMDRLAKRRNELADALGMDHACGWDDLIKAAAEARAELTRSENARERLRADRDEARGWARHGYEIGQKHCSWSDHGVAPAWLTEGWPPHIDSCEHLTRAAGYDTALTGVRSLHQPQPDGTGQPDGRQCRTCSQDGGDGYQYLAPWPCPTVRALDGTQEPL